MARFPGLLSTCRLWPSGSRRDSALPNLNDGVDDAKLPIELCGKEPYGKSHSSRGEVPATCFICACRTARKLRPAAARAPALASTTVSGFVTRAVEGREAIVSSTFASRVDSVVASGRGLGQLRGG